MGSVVYYIIVYMILAAAGMAVANKKAEPAVRTQRWLKYFFYVLVCGIVVLSIFLNFFNWLTCLIVIAGFVELFRVNSLDKNERSFLPFLIYVLIGTGFIFFAFTFKKEALLFIYFQVLIFDAFSQIIGQLAGRHLLIPGISPTKTIEGLAGGFVCCVISAWLGAEWVNLPAIQAVGFGLFTALTSFCGDILASYYKRRVKIKDYSNWLPGQGGFLDRFDSFIFTGAAYRLAGILLFKWFLN